MNDATAKQIAAAKPTVNNGSAIWTQHRSRYMRNDTLLRDLDEQQMDKL